VRLKVDQVTGETYSEEVFQFLSVRLKEGYRIDLQPPTMKISIPFGAIKRCRTFIHYILLTFISIPFGAIKSNYIVKRM